MKTIYHIVTIAFVIYELTCIVGLKNSVKSVIKMHYLSKKFKGKSYSEWSQEYKDIAMPRMIAAILFLIWMVCGLITFNWVLFLGFIIVQFLIMSPIMKIFRGMNHVYTFLYLLNSILGMAFGIFILLNSYHLNIDFFELVKVYFMK